MEIDEHLYLNQLIQSLNTRCQRVPYADRRASQMIGNDDDFELTEELELAMEEICQNEKDLC